MRALEDDLCCSRKISLRGHDQHEEDLGGVMISMRKTWTVFTVGDGSWARVVAGEVVWGYILVIKLAGPVLKWMSV